MATIEQFAQRQAQPQDRAYRTPPHNLEAEQALLGAILINNDAFDRVSDFLRSEHFVEEIHRRIFEIAGSLIRAGKLASEGWRVVWIGSGDAARTPADFAAAAGAAIQVCTDVCAHDATRSNLGHGPQPLATAFNGLAG